MSGEWREVPSDRIADAVASAAESDSVLAVGGGSAIDLAKAISAETGLPLVSVPTTYSGAEWTPTFGIRDPGRRMRGGGSGARLAGIVYDPELTLGLPRLETVGTSMNALDHAAEALYVKGRNEDGDREALAGASLIGEWLPRVVESRTTSKPGAGCSKAPCTRAPPSPQPGSASPTRWRRRSVGASASRTVR